MTSSECWNFLVMNVKTIVKTSEVFCCMQVLFVFFVFKLKRTLKQDIDRL